MRKAHTIDDSAIDYVAFKTSMIWALYVLTHWSRDKMAAISQTTFSSAFSWMKMFDFWRKFHWTLFLKV